MHKNTRRIGRAGQTGVVLVITLIVLVSMTLATIALMRSVDTTNIIAGNLAFQQSARLAADAGIDDAVRVSFPFVISSGQLSTGDCGNNLGYKFYYEPHLEPPAQTWEQWWNGAIQGRACDKSLVQDPLGNTVSYVIERLCSKGNECLLTPPTEAIVGTNGKCPGGNLGKPNERCNGLQYQYYRITARSVGPRNTVSYIQTIVAK